MTDSELNRECSLCGNDATELVECKRCGELFCADCGDFENEVCDDCLDEEDEE